MSSYSGTTTLAKSEKYLNSIVATSKDVEKKTGIPAAKVEHQMFIHSIAPLAQAAQRKYGVSASILLAYAALGGFSSNSQKHRFNWLCVNSPCKSADTPRCTLRPGEKSKYCFRCRQQQAFDIQARKIASRAVVGAAISAGLSSDVILTVLEDDSLSKPLSNLVTYLDLKRYDKPSVTNRKED